ncbi:MAG: Holliday junction branch migration protein RuvA [Blastochloris sp.]|nr:Holliday junction branch migration protein RuvA [Blastochloris sp.]
MIASLRGNVLSVRADHVVIEAGGVGYKVLVPPNSVRATEGEELFLHTVFIVREDAMTLYGFGTTGERDYFDLILSVSGVGPKIALAMLATISFDNLRNAVATGNTAPLTRVPGVGKKLAEKIVFELRDKLKGADGIVSPGSAFVDVNRDVLDALAAFGYSASEAQAAINALPADMPADFDERLRRALQYFVRE